MEAMMPIVKRHVRIAEQAARVGFLDSSYWAMIGEAANLPTAPLAVSSLRPALPVAALGGGSAAPRQARCAWRRARGRGRSASIQRRIRPPSPAGIPTRRAADGILRHP